MLYKNTKFTLAALAAATLVACGGGGDGGSNNGGTPPTVTTAVNGTAAKGILIGAEVTVATASAPDTLLQTIPAVPKTGSDGKFSFDLVHSTNGEPLIVTVKAVAGTQYKNELEIDSATGDFKIIAATPGMTLRTFTQDPSQPTNVNPFTEAAAAYAEAAGFTAEAINNSKELAKYLAGGIDPFNIEPVASVAALNNASPATLQLLSSLASFAAASQNCVSAIETDPIKCQILKIQDTAKDAVSGDTSSLSTFAADMAAVAEDALKEVKAVAPSVNVPSFTPPTTLPDLPKVEAPEDLERFLDILETKAAEEDSMLKVIDKAFLNNYEHLINISNYKVLEHAYGFATDCEIDSTNAAISCDSDSPWQANGATATRSLNGTNSDGVVTGSITVNAEIDGDKAIATFEGQRKINGNPDSELDMTISYAVANPPSKNWNSNSNIVVDVDSTFKIQDTNKESSIVLQGTLKPISNDGDYKAAFTGKAELITAHGDEFAGDLSSTLLMNRSHDAYALESFKFRSTEASLVRSGKNALPISLAASGSYYPAAFTGENFDNFSISGDIGVSSNNITDVYKLTLSRTKAQSMDVTLRLYNLVATLKAESNKASGDYCFSFSGSDKLCADTLRVESTLGNYYVSNFDLDGFNGDVIEKGYGKIGSISNGVVNVDGRTFSLR